MHRLILALVLLLAAFAPAHAAPKRQVIIDDEGFALMHLMLLEDPLVEVLGITSASGNVWANPATAMALRGLELTGHEGVPVAEAAAECMTRVVRAHPYEVTIMACGPLTNLALAQWLDPEFAGLVKEPVVMGAALRPGRCWKTAPLLISRVNS